MRLNLLKIMGLCNGITAIILIFGGCDVDKGASSQSSTSSFNLSRDNDYLSETIQGDESFFQIKKPVNHTVFIAKSNISDVMNTDIDEISKEDFEKMRLVILPSDHWLAKVFIANPFVDMSNEFALTRPSIWGHSLTKLLEDKDSVLFSIDEQLEDMRSLPRLYDTDGSFGPKLKSLGKGGVGEVFEIKHNAADYALKQGAKEFSELEKLQFTRAVIEVYAAFSKEGAPHMVMKRGDKSLADMIVRKEKLSNDQILVAVERFIGLMDAQKVLGIKNLDIKPRNMLVTEDGIKVIDISATDWTSAYLGTEGQLYARSLIEARLSKYLRLGRR